MNLQLSSNTSQTETFAGGGGWSYETIHNTELTRLSDWWFVTDIRRNNEQINKQKRRSGFHKAACCCCDEHTFATRGRKTTPKLEGAPTLSLPAGGRVQAFAWPVGAGRAFLRGGLPPIRSEWWTLETVGDWGMLGRVRDLANRGLCSFLSSDLFGHKR